MWSWALRLVGAVPRKLWLVLAGAVLAAVVVWRVYDAGYDAARAECESAAAERTAETVRALQDELAARDEMLAKQAKQARTRRQDLQAELSTLREEYDNASNELQRCGRMAVPESTYKRLRERATTGRGGTGDGTGGAD